MPMTSGRRCANGRRPSAGSCCFEAVGAEEFDLDAILFQGELVDFPVRIDGVINRWMVGVGQSDGDEFAIAGVKFLQIGVRGKFGELVLADRRNGNEATMLRVSLVAQKPFEEFIARSRTVWVDFFAVFTEDESGPMLYERPKVNGDDDA
jgi:hypothetical protein